MSSSDAGSHIGQGKSVGLNATPAIIAFAKNIQVK